MSDMAPTLDQQLSHALQQPPTSRHAVVISTFEPFTLQQAQQIIAAAGQVETLHVVITINPNPHPCYTITGADKARWLQMAFQDLPFIRVHLLDQVMPDATTHRHQTDKVNDWLSQVYESICVTNQAPIYVSKHMPDSYWLNSIRLSTPQILDMSNNDTLAQDTIPSHPTLDATTVQQSPVSFWQYIHPQARSSYTKTVAIVGGESSGKTTLVHKLANHYGANVVLEMGRLYVDTDLGGSEQALQYSDYMPIALDHAQAIRKATYCAPAPVTIVDTDFVTTQAFCLTYEGQRDPLVDGLIDTFRLDHTLMLDNNTPWVDDGLRSLGDQTARRHFAKTLQQLYQEHNITPYLISDPDYQVRYQCAVEYINQQIINPTLNF